MVVCVMVAVGVSLTSTWASWGPINDPRSAHALRGRSFAVDAVGACWRRGRLSTGWSRRSSSSGRCLSLVGFAIYRCRWIWRYLVNYCTPRVWKFAMPFWRYSWNRRKSIFFIYILLTFPYFIIVFRECIINLIASTIVSIQIHRFKDSSHTRSSSIFSLIMMLMASNKDALLLIEQTELLTDIQSYAVLFLSISVMRFFNVC